MFFALVTPTGEQSQQVAPLVAECDRELKTWRFRFLSREITQKERHSFECRSLFGEAFDVKDELSISSKVTVFDLFL